MGGRRVDASRDRGENCFLAVKTVGGGGRGEKALAGDGWCGRGRSKGALAAGQPLQKRRTGGSPTPRAGSSIASVAAPSLAANGGGGGRSGGGKLTEPHRGEGQSAVASGRGEERREMRKEGEEKS